MTRSEFGIEERDGVFPNGANDGIMALLFFCKIKADNHTPLLIEHRF